MIQSRRPENEERKSEDCIVTFKPQKGEKRSEICLKSLKHPGTSLSLSNVEMWLAPGRTAAIKVENIQGDILLICGDDDESMMTTKMVEKITSRLRKYGRESKCTVRCYPGTGHLIEPPYAPPCTRSYHKTYRMSIEWGGKPRQHAMAQEDSWKHILNFFSTKLAFASYSSRL